MAIDLCESFRALAFGTFDQLGKGRRVGHQPLEETFTDTNILELKDRHKHQIFSQTFNKHQEGKNGADWEWWLTNSTRSSWLGLRVQAKVLNLNSNSFEHLHYRSGKSKSYQLSKLKRQSAKEGLIPLYCFYSHIPFTSSLRGLRGSCGTFPYAPESYGCALAPLTHIEALQEKGETKDLASVLAHAHPWHCLVCCSGYGGADLPSRAWALLRHEFGTKEPRNTRKGQQEVVRENAIGLRQRPPAHVLAVMNGHEPDSAPPDLRGVLVISESPKAN